MYDIYLNFGINLLKYIAAAGLIFFIWYLPIFVLNRNSKAAKDAFTIRALTIGFGWTGLFWLYALWLACNTK